MPNYYDFMMRHGEFVIQELLERIERNEGISADTSLSLEERWFAVMQGTQTAEPNFALASV
jgi:hypothetical protein